MNRISNLIYLDYNKTSPPDPRVLECMMAYADEKEPDGQLIAKTDQQLGELLNADPPELLYTSGATESIQLVIKSVYEKYNHRGSHLITCLSEHPAVLKCHVELEKQGAEVSYIGVDREGIIDLQVLRSAIKPETILVSIMAVNNETGVMQPIEEIAELCAEHGIFFFCDASLFAGKLRCDTKELGLTALALSAHKMYGPQDIGLLYIQDTHKDLMEYIRKTYNYRPRAKQLAGFGKAAEISMYDYWENSAHISKLKNYLEHQVLDIPELRINGSTKNRLYTTSNLQIPDLKKMHSLKEKFDFADNLSNTSHVLKAMGLTDEEIKHSFRFSFGKDNTLEDVKLLVKEILQKD